MLLGLFPDLRPSFDVEGESVPIDMTTTIVLVMFVVGAVIMYVGRPDVSTVPDQSVFKAGMISAIALFGIAWLTATFISAHEEYIIDTIGGWVTDWKFLFALAVFLVAALTTSQSTATRTIVPIGLAAGLAPGVVTGMWAGGLGGVYTLPANGTQIAAANFDLSGTTKLGTKLHRPQLLHPHAGPLRDHHRRGRRSSARCSSEFVNRPTPLNRDRTEQQMQTQEVADKAATIMPAVIAELERLVAIPSVAFPGYPPEPVDQMAAETLQMFRDVGFENAQFMDVPTGYPPIYAEIQGPPGSPVVMLYAHYDVQPAPPEQGWTSDPWTATTKADGRIYGRGAADDKGGLACHLGTMRVFDGKPPCTIKLILEGMEETASNLEAFVDAHQDLFACDLFLVCDMGNLRVGEPVLTTTLRGHVAAVVKVRTLDHPLHSGVFGGAAPDAMMALARLLTTLHDDAGDVAIAGRHATRAAGGRVP